MWLVYVNTMSNDNFLNFWLWRRLNFRSVLLIFFVVVWPSGSAKTQACSGILYLNAAFSKLQECFAGLQVFRTGTIFSEST